VLPDSEESLPQKENEMTMGTGKNMKKKKADSKVAVKCEG